MGERHAREKAAMQRAHDLTNVQGPDGQPIMTAEMLKSVSKGDPNKVESVVGDALFKLDQSYRQAQERRANAYMSNDLLNSVTNRNATNAGVANDQSKIGAYLAEMSRVNQGHDLENQMLAEKLKSLRAFDQGPNLKTLYDPATNRPFGLMQESPDSWIPTPGGRPQESVDRPPIPSPDGTSEWIDGKGWVPRRAAAGNNVDKNAALTQIDSEVATVIKNAGTAGKRLNDTWEGTGKTYQQHIDELYKERDALESRLRGGSSAAPPAPVQAPAQGVKTLDQDTARQFMQQAGGDKAKARQLATAAGYSF